MAKQRLTAWDQKPMSETDKTEAAPAKGGKGRLMLIMGLVLGLALGGGGGVAYFTFLVPSAAEGDPAAADAPKHEEEAESEEPKNLKFIKVDRVSVPLISQDRKVVGYVHLDLQIAVDGDEAERLFRHELPIAKHAVNAALSEIGAGKPDNPRIIDYDGTAARIKDAMNGALSEPVVESVEIVSTTPL